MQFAVAKLLVAVALVAAVWGCGNSGSTGSPLPSGPPSIGSSWLGLPSAVNQIIIVLYEGTGWLLNKSEVSVKKVGDIRAREGRRPQFVADFRISVHLGDETFETTATDIPCDELGIPTEASIDQLREAVESIKTKMKRLQE